MKVSNCKQIPHNPSSTAIERLLQRMERGVSIVIPTWNGLSLLQRFLPSVLAAANTYVEGSGAPVEIILVDDGSTDQSARWLKEEGFIESIAASQKPGAIELEAGRESGDTPSKKLVRCQVNSGFGEACNRGFAAATCPLVFLLNNDVEVERDAIAPLVENFAEPSVFAVHCRVLELESGEECGTGKVGGFARGFIRVHRSYVPATTGAVSGPLYSIFAGGGSAMFDRRKFLEVGGFESLLSPFYWEDVELSYRAWKRGFTVLYEPRSVTRHRVSSTIGRLDRTTVRRIEQRNRLVYHWIHLHDRRLLASHVLWVLLLVLTSPLRLKPGFIRSAVAALKRLRAVQRRRREERAAASRTDREVLMVFADLIRRPDVEVYDGKPGRR